MSISVVMPPREVKDADENSIIQNNKNIIETETVQREQMKSIYKALQREFNRLDMLDMEEDNEHRHAEMDEIRVKYKKELDVINATNKQRQDITRYVIGNAKFLNYSDWVDDMIDIIQKNYKSGSHIF